MLFPYTYVGGEFIKVSPPPPLFFFLDANFDP